MKEGSQKKDLKKDNQSKSNTHKELFKKTNTKTISNANRKKGNQAYKQQKMRKKNHSRISKLKIDSLPPKQAQSGKLTRIAIYIKNLRSIVVDVVIICLVIFLIILIIFEFRKKFILIDPFNVPQNLIENGYTGEIIATKLKDQIIFIRTTANRTTARTSQQSIQIIPSWLESKFEIKTSIANIPFQYFVQSVKEVFRREPRRITGEVVIAKNQIYLSVRIGVEPVKIFPGEAQNLEQILLQAAEHLYKYIAPYYLALYFDETDRSDVIETLQYILERKPQDEHIWAYNLWGSFLHDKADYTAAIEKYQKAIELEPKFAPAYINWGGALDDMRDYDGAISKYQQTIKISSEYAPVAYVNWASSLIGKEDYSEAIAKCQIALELNPRLPQAYINWGIALDDLGNHEAAIAKYKRALELNPKLSQAYHNWGAALHDLGNHEAAIAKYKRALELNPGLPEAYINWGAALDSMGDYDGAIEKYQKAIEVKPEAKNVEELKKIVQKLKKKSRAVK